MRYLAIAILALCVTIGATQAADTKLKVGVSMPSATHGWMANANYWANKAKEDWAQWDPNVEIELKFSGTSNQQASDIEDLVTKDIDALVVFPHDTSVTNVVEQAFNQGIYVVVLDRGVSKEGIYDLYITGDDYNYSRKGMKFLIDSLGGNGNVIIISGTPTPIDTIRTNAAKEIAAEYPGIKVLDVQPGEWNRQKTLAVMENMLQKYPKIDGVFTCDDDMMLGAIQAYRESGRSDIKMFVGGGALKNVVKEIVDDTNPLVKADCTYPPSVIATATSYAILGARGEKLNPYIYQIRAMPSRIIVPAELITKENAAEFYNPDTPF
ncbi:MAG: substrate-binding domain-containing protein [Planctomycetaceae bacterium]|nr:substrate-binding domain-containing protein [Planctomycetaceae bacterium]